MAVTDFAIDFFRPTDFATDFLSCVSYSKRQILRRMLKPCERSQRQKQGETYLGVKIHGQIPRRVPVGNGPNTVSESTASNTELSEFLGPHQVLERELSEFLSAYDLCAKANSPSFSQNSPSLPQNSVSSVFKTVLSEQCSTRFLFR